MAVTKLIDKWNGYWVEETGFTQGAQFQMEQLPAINIFPKKKTML